MGKARRSISTEFKFRVDVDLLTGRKRRVEVVREHQLVDSTLERWCKQFQRRGPRVFGSEAKLDSEEDRFGELERVIGRLTVELEASHLPWRAVPGQGASNWLKSR